MLAGPFACRGPRAPAPHEGLTRPPAYLEAPLTKQGFLHQQGGQAPLWPLPLPAPPLLVLLRGPDTGQWLPLWKSRPCPGLAVPRQPQTDTHPLVRGCRLPASSSSSSGRASLRGCRSPTTTVALRLRSALRFCSASFMASISEGGGDNRLVRGAESKGRAHKRPGSFLSRAGRWHLCSPREPGRQAGSLTSECREGAAGAEALSEPPRRPEAWGFDFHLEMFLLHNR